MHSHLPLLLFLCSANTIPALHDGYSFAFTSDNSALSYRPISIKQMVDDAIRTHSSLHLKLKASQLVNFGFLKCGVYGLATVLKAREVRYVFIGKELENIKNMIDKSCASDNHTSSFDLVIQSPEHTQVSLNFSVLARNETSDTDIEIHQHLRSMYPLSVRFDLPANSSASYPIQMKALVRRIMRTSGSRLRIRTSSSAPALLQISLDRCEWEIEHKHFPFVEEKIYKKDHVEAIGGLMNHSCDSEWLLDTVNVQVTSLSDFSTSGVIKFDILYPEVYEQEGESKVKGQAVKSPTVAMSMAVNRKPARSIGLFMTLCLYVLFGVLCSIFLLFVLWSRSKRRVYHVADYDEFRHKSVLP